MALRSYESEVGGALGTNDEHQMEVIWCGKARPGVGADAPSSQYRRPSSCPSSVSLREGSASSACSSIFPFFPLVSSFFLLLVFLLRLRLRRFLLPCLIYFFFIFVFVFSLRLLSSIMVFAYSRSDYFFCSRV